MSKTYEMDLEESQSFLSYKNLLEQDETSDEATETSPLNVNNQSDDYKRPNSPSILISPPDNDKQPEQISLQDAKKECERTAVTHTCECKHEASTQTELLLSVPSESPTMLRAAMTLCRLRPWQCARTKKQREERKKLMQNNQPSQ